MTLHKLHAGDGYTYLTRQVAAGDEGRSPGQQLVDYYTASGNPPGRWVGSGASDLGVTGRVREDQMRSLFGHGLHPDAEQIVALEVAARASAEDARQATRLGRSFSVYTPLPPRAERVAARLAAFEAERGHPPSPVVRSKIEAQEARRERRAVAGYDLVFTPVKSASLLWALGSAATRQAVEAAHDEAVADTLAWLEQETAFARVGDRGERQIDTHGFIGAAFTHRDSRAGDPDLHTHLAISNKVRAVQDHPDGRPRWLSLDARVLHAAGVAASERYNTRFEDALSRRLGVRFEDRAPTRTDKRPVREITGVPASLIVHFSKRRAAIEDRYRELATEYRTTHGHEPPTSSQLKLAQQATLETREAKGGPQSLADKITGWRHEAAGVVGRLAVVELDRSVTRTERDPASVVETLSTDAAALVAAAAVARVSEEKATWTRWNLIAEIERQLRSHRFSTLAARESATTAVLVHALNPDLAVQLTADGIALLPVTDDEALLDRRSSDGASVLVEHGSARYTTQDLLDAEQLLLTQAQQPTRHHLTTARVNELVSSFEDRHRVTLDSGQHALVHSFTTDPRRLVVGIGPAGAGKTTAMRAVAATWRTTGHRVIPLAASASAAAVLAEELGCRADNLHKFRYAHTVAASDGDSGRQTDDFDSWFILEPGDLVLVDEAGMTGTRNLAWLTKYARERGAVVRLIGDPAQLTSVEAGGALHLIGGDAGAVELTDLHRFDDPDEATATLGLRQGDPHALDFYFDHDRVSGGSTSAMLEAAYEGWTNDTREGRTSLLIAATNRDVAALSTRARLDRIRDGQVKASGVTLHDGTTAGVGDRVTTRKNERTLTGCHPATYVKNGDVWTIHRRHSNGDLTVRHAQHNTVVRLPTEYVADHVELAYATTAARAQGRTVDTCHVLVADTANRQSLYVAATRGRSQTHLYVVEEALLALEAERPPASRTTTRERLTAVVSRATQEMTATATRRVTRVMARGSADRHPNHSLRSPDSNLGAPSHGLRV